MHDPTSNAPDQASDPTGERPDHDALRELALRLATTPSPYMPPPDREPQLFVGQIPPVFPAETPLPDGCRVLGTVVARTATFYLNVNRPANEVLRFYRERMRAAGWTEPEMPSVRHGGFMPASFPLPHRALLCKGEQGPGLTIVAYDVSGKPTDVRVELDTYADNPERGPCAPQRQIRMHPGAAMWNLLPALVPPPGARLSPEGGGSGDDHVHTSATLQGDLAVAQVESHYAGQLQQASWIRADSGESGLVAWSAWTLMDANGEPWRATLVVLRQSEHPRSYFLLLRAQAESRRPGGAMLGSQSWAGMTLRGG